ncbi:MAG TPA: hypothetical protein VIK74_07010, partial [Parasegetibacter sp.]
MKLTTTGLTFLYIIIFALNGLAQSGIEFDLEKPKKFENRTLGYEKTYQTKFGPVKRFVQNNITHFNYYFNAQQKLNKLIAQAKTAHLDDFTQLLPFYDYSLNTTAANPRELDSVIIKATTGLLIHDLRNDWADNMYMLMGQAYFYKQQFDSADIVFQFVNYAFAPKEKDGYDKIIGSNSSEGGSVLSISTKEKKSLLKSAFSVPPSRNDALLWRIRIAIEQNQPAKASGLIETLKKDPVFPDRLKPELEELHAYHFYKLNIYDSAAIHLTNALENSSGSQDRARKEYLIAQLYERSNQPQNAVDFYSRAVSHTLNPIMDIYARLNMIRLNKDGGDDYIQNNIDALVKMGKRDRYTQYRDIIYYTAAVMEGERKNIPSAANFIDKSIRYNTGNIALKNKAFLLAGDLHFSAKNFELAQAAYDSVNLVDPSILNIEEITSRKNALNKLVSSMSTIRRQDSLQALAALSPEERDKLINQMLKADRKKSDKKDHTAFPTNIDGGDLFAQDNKSGEWYFYNSSVRSKGYTAFRQKWGDRPNVDNWRRLSAINRLSAQIQDESNAPDNTVSTDENAPLTYESLLANIPLTDEQMVVSNDSIQAAMINLGLTYQIDLEDYRTAAQIYEDLLLRFPDVTEKEAVYY